MENCTANASVLTLIAISFERFYATCYPLRTLYKLTVKRNVQLLIVSWIIAIFAAIPYLFIATTFTTKHSSLNREVEVCHGPLNTHLRKGFVIITYSLFYVVALFLLILLYTKIAWKMNKRENTILSSSSRSVESHNTQRRQIIHMMMAVVVLFFICHLPMRVILLFYTFSSKKTIDFISPEIQLNMLNAARTLFYLNSSINPILYNALSNKFRKAFKMSFMCKTSQTDANWTEMKMTEVSCATKSKRSSFTRINSL